MLTLTKKTSIIILTLTNARRKTKFSDKEHIFLIFFSNKENIAEYIKPKDKYKGPF